MKKLLTAIIIAAVALTAQAQLKLGVVDGERIYAAIPEVEQAKQALEEASAQYQNELQQMRLDFQKKYTDYQAVSTDALNESIRERRIQELQELDQRIQEFVAVAASDMQKQQERLIAPIEKRVADAVKAVGHAHGYTVVYGDLAITPAGNTAAPAVLQPVYLSDEVTDITDIVIAYLTATPAPAE